MSSSDDDAEFLEPSPSVEPITRRGNRRKAHTPSPRKVPRKKQREVLADFNVELEDSDEDAEEEHGPRTNLKGVHQGKRKRVDISSTESNLDEEDDPRVSTTSEMENMPPPATTAASLADDIPEESSQQTNNGEGQVRARKRLSIRSDATADGRRSSISGSSTVESVVASANEVQTIYETCSQMFNANRICPQNAFNLRLLDCINQMINSPGYDKSNMQLTSSTVEIGTKIYVCRVDNTHSQVLSLASEISLQQRRKKKDGTPEGENQEDNEAGRADEDAFDDEEGNARRQKQKKKGIKKRGRFVEADNSKLLTGLEEQNVKYVTRRNLLKKKFNQMIYDDLEFDYMSYFLEPEEEHPLHTAQEHEKMNTKFIISDVYTNAIEMGKLVFLPFSHLPKFDPEIYDVWGRPLNEAEEMRHQFSQEPQALANDEFAYDPANRPAEYPDEGFAENGMNDTLGEALPHFGDADDDGEGGIPAVSFHNIRSLDHLDDYFQKVRNLLKISKSKYGWCGPNFVRPKATWQVQKQGQRKPRVRKEPERIEFDKINWTDKANKFNPNQAGRTIFDDKIIESWSAKKTAIPFLGVEITSYDDDFDPLDFQNENDPKYVPTIFKLFTSRNRSILDLLKASDRKRSSSGGSFAHSHCGDDGFDHDNDIELPRDIAEDFCSQQTNEDGYHPPDGTTPGDAAWQFPSSMPGLLNDDPLSLVSGIDSIRFSRKPKPIDMSQLKRAILKTLTTSLNLHPETSEPLSEEECTINLAQLMLQVLKTLDTRTEKLLSVPIFIVALMHVVADKRLFVLYDDNDPDCPVVLCRGNNFNHRDHIPMPVDGLDFE